MVETEGIPRATRILPHLKCQVPPAPIELGGGGSWSPGSRILWVQPFMKGIQRFLVMHKVGVTMVTGWNYGPWAPIRKGLIKGLLLFGGAFVVTQGQYWSTITLGSSFWTTALKAWAMVVSNFIIKFLLRDLIIPDGKENADCIKW